MATGLELIISTVCNATFCEAVYDNPTSDNKVTKERIAWLALANELNGKHLKVATYSNYPLSWVEQNENGTFGRGVAFIIMDVLQERFNFTFEVVTPTKNYEVGGDLPEDSVIGLVNSSIVDLAAAFIPTVVKFRRKVQFSKYLDEGVWSMMLRRPAESATGSGLLAPFDTDVWYVTLVALLCYVPCISLLTWLRNKLVKDEEGHIPLSPSFWFVYAGFVKQGTALAPDANMTRMLFATWWIFIILLSSFYTANLTAFLTLSKFTLDISSHKDLYKKNYRWVAADGGAIQFMVNDPKEDLYVLRRMVESGRAEFRSFIRDRDYLPLVLDGAVLVKEQIAIDHLMYADYLKKASEGVQESYRCTYVVAPEAFVKLPRAFAFPINSTLHLLFDPILSFLLQAGIIDFLQIRDLPGTKMCPLDLQSTDRNLRNSDLLMTYFLMGIGLAVAGAVFIGEILLRRIVKIKSKSDTKKNGSKRKKSRKIRFKDHDDSHPPPYDSLFGLNSRYKHTGNAKTKIINGREYYVVDTVHGDTRLIPVRTPSAYLYQ